MRAIITIAAFACCTGCMSISVDRNKSADLWKPFLHGQKYELTEDVFLISLKGKHDNLVLVPSKQSRLTANNCYEWSGYYSAPESIEAYQTSRTSGGSRVVSGHTDKLSLKEEAGRVRPQDKQKQGA